VEGSVFGAVSLLFFFGANLLKGFAPNSHGRHVWSLVWTSLTVEVKGQGRWGQNIIFGPFGGLRVVYVWYNIFSLYSLSLIFQKEVKILASR